MDRFIGLDVHASSCTFGVVGASGKRLRSQVVETNGGIALHAQWRHDARSVALLMA